MEITGINCRALGYNMKRIFILLLTFILIPVFVYAGPPSPKGVIIEEVDGDPSNKVTKIIMPDGSLSISGSTATYSGAPGAGSIGTDELEDGGIASVDIGDEQSSAKAVSERFSSDTVSQEPVDIGEIKFGEDK